MLTNLLCYLCRNTKLFKCYRPVHYSISIYLSIWTENLSIMFQILRKETLYGGWKWGLCTDKVSGMFRLFTAKTIKCVWPGRRIWVWGRRWPDPPARCRPSPCSGWAGKTSGCRLYRPSSEPGSACSLETHTHTHTHFQQLYLWSWCEVCVCVCESVCECVYLCSGWSVSWWSSVCI